MPDTNKSIASILDDLYEKLTGVEDPTDDKYTIAQKLKQITSLFTEEELPEKATISGYLDIFKNAFNGGGGGNPDETIEAFLKGEVEELTLQSEVLTPGMISLLGGLKHIYAPNATEVQAYAIRSINSKAEGFDTENVLYYNQIDYTPYEIDWEHPRIWNEGDVYFEYVEYSDVMQSEFFTDPIFMNFSIDLPEVTNIEDRAFTNASGLTMINTGNKLVRIGYDAFYYCKSLKQVPNWSDELMIIEDGAFHGCTYMRGSVYIPDTITYLGHNAFLECGIDEINIGGLQFIPSSLCQYCDNLKKINIREGVQFTKSYAFYSAYSVNEIHLPGTLSTIENHSFFSCYFPIVTIPKTYHIDTSGGYENHISHQLRFNDFAFYLTDTITDSLLEKLVPDIDDRHVEPGTNLDIQICVDLSEYDVNTGDDFKPPIVDFMSVFGGSDSDSSGWTNYMLDSTRNIYYRVRYVFLFNDQDTLDAFKQLTNWASYDVDRFMLKSDYAGPLGDQPGYFNVE